MGLAIQGNLAGIVAATDERLKPAGQVLQHARQTGALAGHRPTAQTDHVLAPVVIVKSHVDRLDADGGVDGEDGEIVVGVTVADDAGIQRALVNQSQHHRALPVGQETAE